MPNKLIKANDGTLVGSSFFAVGSVQQTFLSQAEFESIMGSDWVPADGRDVTGSVYEQITGNSAVPDCRGMFLRSVGGNSESTIGASQSDATKKNGLVVSGGTASGTFASSTHFHEVDGRGTRSFQNSNGWQYTQGGTVLNPGQNYDSNAASATASVSSTAASINDGDVETRPVNITVNTYIKIN